MFHTIDGTRRAYGRGVGGAPTIRAEYDWSAVSPSTAVIEAVADAADTEPEALEPLHGHVDPDGIDALFGDGPGNHTKSGLFVSFRYAGHEVTIGEGGVITVTEE